MINWWDAGGCEEHLEVRRESEKVVAVVCVDTSSVKREWKGQNQVPLVWRGGKGK